MKKEPKAKPTSEAKEASHKKYVVRRPIFLEPKAPCTRCGNRAYRHDRADADGLGAEGLHEWVCIVCSHRIPLLTVSVKP